MRSVQRQFLERWNARLAAKASDGALRIADAFMEVARCCDAKAVAVATSNAELPEIRSGKPSILLPTEENLHEIEVLSLNVENGPVALVVGPPIAIQNIVAGQALPKYLLEFSLRDPLCEQSTEAKEDVEIGGGRPVWIELCQLATRKERIIYRMDFRRAGVNEIISTCRIVVTHKKVFVHPRGHPSPSCHAG